MKAFSRTYHWLWLMQFVLLVLLSLGCWLLPWCDKENPLVDAVAPLALSVGVVSGNWSIYQLIRKSAGRHSWHPLLLILLSAGAIYSFSERSHSHAKVLWDFEGPVLEKYRSSNHGAYSIRVGGSKPGRFEFVGADLWNAVVEGDWVRKRVCTDFVELQEQRFRVVR